MKFEDSRDALFPEPNAYIQNFGPRENQKDKSHPKKIIFQEPYENMPNFYIDNNFKKGNCDCIPKPNTPNDKCDPPKNNSPFPFDLKNILPLLSSLGKGGGLSNILSGLTGGQNSKNVGQNSNFDLSSILNLLNSNNGGNGLLDLFKFSNLGNMLNKKDNTKKEMKSTDFCIKDYKRIE